MLLRACAPTAAVVLAIVSCSSSDPSKPEEVSTSGTSTEVPGSSGADAPTSQKGWWWGRRQPSVIAVAN
jgi:hypothetical protein